MEYNDWLANHKAASKARGGRLIRPPSREEEERYRRAKEEGWSHIRGHRKWKPGEIVNPITGEIVTDCLSIAKLAEKAGMTSSKLIDHMETLGTVHRVLDIRQVPMVCAPELQKPRYDRKPEATCWAVEEGYRIPIKVNRSVGMEVKRISMILITPEGQRYVTQRFGKKAGKAGQIVGHLFSEGKSQAEIVQLTGYTQQLVSYHTRRLQKAA